MRKITGILCFISICNILSAQTKQGIQVTDLAQIKTAGNINMSQDGSKAVFTVQAIEPDTAKWEYKYITQLWAVNTDGSAPRQITFAKEGATQPALSPDGKQLAFVRTVDSKPQVFLIGFNGGEAMQLTKLKYGAANPTWSKDGKQVLFTATVSLKELLTDTLLNPGKLLPKWPFEKPGFNSNSHLKPDTTKADPDGNMESIRNYLAQNEKDNKAKVLDRLRFQEESTTSSNISFTHLFIVDAVAGATPKPVTKGFYSFSNPYFLNDTTILMNGNVNDAIHPDRIFESAIFRIYKNGSGLQQLMGKDSMAYQLAAVSASGKWMAFTTAQVYDQDVPFFYIMAPGEKETAKIHIPLDRNITACEWSRDETTLYFTVQTNGGIILKRYNLKTKNIEPLTEANSGVTSFDIAENAILFSKTAVTSPSELFLADTKGNAKQVSAFNTGWLQNRQLSMPEKHSFTNSKGMIVEYWVMKPTNYEAGKKYPLLLEIHGGPSAMWGPGESSMWHEYQYFCSRGYGVVYSNPRGSSGYGVDFLRDNMRDWGAGPAGDVLTALDKTVTEGWADTSKLLITGGSYAGYLVSWIIGHDKRFKAACSQRGVYDLSTFFGEGNAWRLVPGHFGGYPWEEKVKTLLDKESPISYVNNITTPYIIFHGENDLRTGVIQSEMLYKSLKVLNRPVEYVRHPGATHEITRSGNNRQRIDQMLRTYEFFERFIR
ncbi:MAG: S9 family peptidase [Ferruginibacter sp.]